MLAVEFNCATAAIGEFQKRASDPGSLGIVNSIASLTQP